MKQLKVNEITYRIEFTRDGKGIEVTCRDHLNRPVKMQMASFLDREYRFYAYPLIKEGVRNEEN